ncbi:hypothetical protein V6N13_133774 [Hibiscus sabdariffa]|uniref:Uncharacterized protein n=1 Tax=Hibiscus sabdariffa TaxID=183260 RepID=A0ABR2R038_9ROSI
MIIAWKHPLPKDNEELKVNESLKDIEAPKCRKASKRRYFRGIRCNGMQIWWCKSVMYEANDVRDASAINFRALKENRDDGVNLVNEINRILYCKIGDISPLRDNIVIMYATDGDLPSTAFQNTQWSS